MAVSGRGTPSAIIGTGTTVTPGTAGRQAVESVTTATEGGIPRD
ncbi:hypothetical protein [Nonomuraea phyllanthi]|nr:hypothetical protein [Nonomuraea phyllanthi]